MLLPRQGRGQRLLRGGCCAVQTMGRRALFPLQSAASCEQKSRVRRSQRCECNSTRSKNLLMTKPSTNNITNKTRLLFVPQLVRGSGSGVFPLSQCPLKVLKE